MSEYWKSTPKYWCKYCSVYVRDTNLERANHESTARHQGAIKRSLRDLHRNHEQEEREKERAKREVARLNGVVGGSSGAPGPRPGAGAAQPGAAEAPRPVTQAQRQAQLEQLSAMGVEIPTEYRANMALAGEWTVTATRVVKDEAHGQSKEGEDDVAAEGRAKGVRKREAEETEEKKDEEAAIKGLFKKRKTWGGARAMPEADAELDALLSGGLALKKEEVVEEEPAIKREEGAAYADEAVPGSAPEAVAVKPDLDAEGKLALSSLPDSGMGPVPTVPAVVFKKRKPKNARQK